MSVQITNKRDGLADITGGPVFADLRFSFCGAGGGPSLERTKLEGVVVDVGTASTDCGAKAALTNRSVCPLSMSATSSSAHMFRGESRMVWADTTTARATGTLRPAILMCCCYCSRRLSAAFEVQDKSGEIWGW